MNMIARIEDIFGVGDISSLSLKKKKRKLHKPV